ncbi:MAG: NADH-quinone oxidoreductase subunit NuoE [Thermodesulfobacteriota bacterium]
MLNEKLQDLVRAEVERAPTRAAACLDALRIVQQHFGWISDDNLAALSEVLGMTREELESVSTFYNHIFRRPVGRHIIHVCDSITCWMMGHETILTYLKERLGVTIGETTEDNRFTILPIQCLGACDGAPAIMIDDDLHCCLTPEKIDRVLEAYL